MSDDRAKLVDEEHHQEEQPTQPEQASTAPGSHQPTNDVDPLRAEQEQPQQQQSLAIWHANYRDYLSKASSLHVKHEVNSTKAFPGWESLNNYTIKDQDGREVLYAAEDTDCLTRQSCLYHRAFTIPVLDPNGNNVLSLDREFSCSWPCGLICSNKLNVKAANGQLVGSIVDDLHLPLYPRFKLLDETGRPTLRLVGPFGGACNVCCSPNNVVFNILNMEGNSIGTISEEWTDSNGGHLFKDDEAFHSHVSFPLDLEPSMKAVCLGALFLVDFEYFQFNPSRN